MAVTEDTIGSLPPATSLCMARSPRLYAPTPTPALHEWEELWALWDLVTRAMIPEAALLSKPIHLRNCCLFYLGHIPAFLDRQLVHGAREPPTEPVHFGPLFERGIDPDVDNPALCHAHSAIPDEWPPLEQILEYQRAVRARLRQFYISGRAAADRRLARSLWLALEHEAMHLETLLYMLLQSDWVLPPPGPRPDFAALAALARKQGSDTAVDWTRIPARTLTIGLNDPETDEGPDRFFGWDNERPPRKVTVAAFVASPRAITNGDYARYLEACGITKYPASWKVDSVESQHATNGTNGIHTEYDATDMPFSTGKSVRTVYGPVPLREALDWPVMASYDELSGCARWMGGRIPTLEEAQSIYAYVDELGPAASLSDVCARTIPAVNGHLSNDGVEETPPQKSERLSPDPTSFFSDLSTCNVGFRAFHPLPPALLHGKGSPHRNQPAGRAGLGGVWEWTSTPLARHEGFVPMDAYPAYTADFFDNKHNVVLGGSWATIPRIAGRKSFVNWYQRNYPYAWCGARVVKDLEQ